MLVEIPFWKKDEGTKRIYDQNIYYGVEQAIWSEMFLKNTLSYPLPPDYTKS
jgi:hypothetical protein